MTRSIIASTGLFICYNPSIVKTASKLLAWISPIQLSCYHPLTSSSIYTQMHWGAITGRHCWVCLSGCLPAWFLTYCLSLNTGHAQNWGSELKLLSFPSEALHYSLYAWSLFLFCFVFIFWRQDWVGWFLRYLLALKLWGFFVCFVFW